MNPLCLQASYLTTANRTPGKMYDSRLLQWWLQRNKVITVVTENLRLSQWWLWFEVVLLAVTMKLIPPIGSHSSCLWALPSPIHSLIAPILQLPSLYQLPFFYAMKLVPWKWKQKVPLKHWYLSTTTSHTTRQQSSVTILEIYLTFRRLMSTIVDVPHR